MPSKWNTIIWLRFGHFVVGPALIVYCLFFEEFTSTDVALMAIGFFLFDSLGLQIGGHKLFSHQSFYTFKWVETALAYLSLMSGQGSPIIWAAIHQGLHHKHTDKELDPHSPNKGFWTSFIAWPWKIERVPFRSVPWLFNKKHILPIHKYYTFIFISTWVAGWLLLGTTKFVSFLVIPSVLSISFAGVMSYFLHTEKSYFFDFLFITYRSFKSEDNAKNSIILGMLSFGTGFHNNHHVYPDRSNVGIKWYEFDPSVLIIPLLRKRKN